MHVDVTLLGQFSISVDGRSPGAGDWRRTRSVAVVKLLALAPRHRMHREQVIDALWPELGPEAGAANLRKAIHYARRTLGEHEIILVEGETLALAPGAEIVVDAEVFEADAAAALKTDDPAAAARAAQLYVGDLLPGDLYAEWTDERRQRLRDLYVRALKAAGLWEQVLSVDPFDERAVRALMQSALDAGDRGEVIRQFQRLRDRLRADMGMGPQAETVKLYERAVALRSVEPAGISERVRGLLAWGIVQLNNGEFGDAREKGEEARLLAIAAKLGREVGEASAIVGITAHMQGRWREMFQSEFVDCIQRSPQFATEVFDANLCLAEFCLTKAGGHDEMRKCAGELLAFAEGAGSIAGRALSLLILGMVEFLEGRLEPAEATLTAAEKLAAEAGTPFGQALALHRLAEIALARGQNWRSNRLAQKGMRLSESTWCAAHSSIRFQCLAVEAATTPQQVREAIEAGDRSLAERTICQQCSMGFRVASAIALAEAGHLDHAVQRINAAERIAGMWQGSPWPVAIWEARGVYRLACGEGGQAAALFREAAARYSEFGRVRDEQRCLGRIAAGGPALLAAS
ncbi:AfsR/SARP family transcriptional regulator [Labrys monachus]|uniref:DNA-binding SARP family transcriptional activator n=1 Tax=Labrys monachus TaxID=217067 RepID=A0ABU0FBY6_9HYPH|nr:BTAD domain-containing putative transcriptional regulator [Labrys monachus]MDQ0392122.1 DNA-binding SARP family transcriptional activator [Labrys monachus]